MLGCTVPPAPTFKQIVREQESRWYRAICRFPTQHSIELIKGKLDCGGVANANGCHSNGEILISNTTDSLERTVAHELGHTFTKQHVAPYAGLLTEYAYQSTGYITRVDIDLVCEGRDCPCRHPEKP